MANEFKDGKLIAPARIGYWLRRKYIKAGRRDAKKFDSLHHSAATPRIVQLQREAQTKQLSVNSWYVQACRPFQTGIAECKTAIQNLQDQLKQKLDERPTSARLQNQLERDALNLEEQIEAQKRQIEFNLANGRTLRMRAEQYLQSWANYQEQLASFYAIGRAQKTKNVQPGVSFTPPGFEGVSLVRIPEFEEQA